MGKPQRRFRLGRPTAAAASRGNVAPFRGLGNHVDLCGLLGGAEGIRTLSPPQPVYNDSSASD
jgi:hypothetical protein